MATYRSAPGLRARVSLSGLFLSLGVAVSGMHAAAAMQVVATTPDGYALAVAPGLATLTITFDETPVLPANPVRVAGTMSGLRNHTFEVAGNALLVHLSGDAFMTGEMVRVNLHRDITGGTSGDPLTGGYYFTFTVASGGGEGAWDEGVVYEASLIPYFIYGGDLDEDGTPDLAVPNEGTNDVSIFQNTSGSGVFDSRTEYEVGTKPSSIFGEDFDNDGDQDLATADIVSGTMSVLINQGDGTFAPPVTHPSGSVCRQVHGGDFDGDLDIDLATTSNGTRQIYVFYNFGNGTFGTGNPHPGVASGPFTMRCEDLNRDGHLDLAVGCQAADQLSVLLNNGTGWFTTLGNYAAGNGPWDLVANDFDADGDCDLLTVLSFGNQIAILTNDGSGAFPTRHAQPTDAFPLGTHCADLDGDGDIDAISSNFNGGNANVFFNDGAGALTEVATLDVSLTGSYPWAHDLDGDGDLDISVVDENADQLFIFYQTSTPTDSPGGQLSHLGGELRVLSNPVRIEEGAVLELRNVKGPRAVDVIAADGRFLRRLDLTLMEGKRLRWDGRDATGRTVAPGRYYLRLETESGRVVTQEIVALR